MSGLGGGGTPCTVCEKTVYPAESMSFEKAIYHIDCFRCSKCNVAKKPADMNQYEKALYCKQCFATEGFAQKQKNVKWTKKEGSSSNALASKFGGGGTKCVACDKTAYPAESVSYDKKIYHRECLKCSKCEKKCAASNINSYEDELFCAQCFQQGGFAQKQRNVKWTKSESSTPSAGLSKFGGGGNKCVACDKTCYAAEQVTFDKKIYHAACLACTLCKKSVKPADANAFEEKLYCRKCFQEQGFAQKQANVKWTKKEGGSGSAVASKFGGGGLKCIACDKTVYAAEAVSFEKQHYHPECFKCKKCSKKLKLAQADGHKVEDGWDVYCTGCFREEGLHLAK